MDRRTYLSLAGTAGITSLAGCGGKLKAATRSGPPHFEEVELTGPSEVQVSEEFYLEVSAKNTGGKSGGFSNTLSAGEGLFSIDQNVRIEEIGVGESESAEIGPYNPGYTRDYQFRITDYGASHTVSVTTKTVEEGEQFSVKDGPSLTVTDASYYPSFSYRSGEESKVFTPSEGSVLAVIQLSVENQTESEIRAGADSFDVPRGEVITGISEYGVSLSTFREPDGQPLTGDVVRPGGTESGWILADVPYEQVRNGLNLGWDRGLYDSVPEASWTLEPGTAAVFEISDFEFPDEVEIGSTATGTVTIQNTGDESGTFRGILERQNVGAHEWEQLETFSLEINAGSNTSWSTEIEEPYIGPTKYRLLPEEVSETVDFVPATRSLGEPYTTHDGLEIVPSIGAVNLSGMTSQYTLDNWDDETVVASSGNQFVFVNVSVVNTDSEVHHSPRHDSFSVLANGEEYSRYQADDWGIADFKSPVGGSEYYGGGNLEPGNKHFGWVVFEVPDDLSREDLTVQLSPDEHLTVKWSA